MSFLANVSNILEPASYAQACTSTEWIQALNKELEALELNQTWQLATLPAGKKAKWVYRIKVKPDGTIDKYKA